MGGIQRSGNVHRVYRWKDGKQGACNRLDESSIAWTAALGSSATATYLSVAVPRVFDRLADRFHQGLTQAPLVDETVVETSDEPPVRLPA